MSPLSNNNTTSPAKRPGLARRSVSSHAIITTRTSPAITTDAVESQKPPTAHKGRAHVVGGGHRTHGRNPSFGKNLNKQQRLLHIDSTASISTARHHQRKKSAPVTPVDSPRTSGSHIRWEGTNTSLGEHKPHTSMRKNLSTPSLHRNTSSTIISKKSLVTERPQSAKARPKKSVGFELVGDSDSEAEWEDSTQSPESTRRGSAVPSTKGSTENIHVLVDPLTFVKRPYPQTLQSRSLPESSINDLPQGIEDSDHEGSDHEPPPSIPSDEQLRTQEPEDIANRLLTQPRISKAPPAMSSISAIGTATAVDTTRRNESLTNLASSQGALRHGSSVPTSSITAQDTSSSIEGGVSRFIINPQAGAHATSRTDSDPNTPSSFLPHYHPQAPPSPERTQSKKIKATSPLPRPPGAGPASRTQQKLWLQRTAALTTSPPDSHGSPTLPQSTIDPAFMAASHSRTGQYDANRGAVNGSARVGTTHESEAKHTRKAYEKIALELHVVRRFQSPAKNSFYRLQRLNNVPGRPGTASQPASGLMGKNSKSAPSLATGQYLQTPPNGRTKVASAAVSENNGSAEETTANGRQQQRGPKPGRVFFQDSDDAVNTSSDSADRLAIEARSDNHHHHHNIHTTAQSDVPASDTNGGPIEQTNPSDREGYFATEQEMLLRRMWESRNEVASPG